MLNKMIFFMFSFVIVSKMVGVTVVYLGSLKMQLCPGSLKT